MVESRRISRGAFTLIELMIVLAIGVVLAAIAAPRYSASLNRYRADGAARRLAADLNLARSTAKATSATCTVSFLGKPDTYEILGMAAPDGGGGGYVVVLSAEPYKATIKGITFTDSIADNTLKLNGYGDADSGVSITITVRGVERTVTLNAGNGVVTVQ